MRLASDTVTVGDVNSGGDCVASGFGVGAAGGAPAGSVRLRVVLEVQHPSQR